MTVYKYARMSFSLMKEASPPHVTIWINFDDITSCDFKESTRMRFPLWTLESASSCQNTTEEQHPEEDSGHTGCWGQSQRLVWLPIIAQPWRQDLWAYLVTIWILSSCPHVTFPRAPSPSQKALGFYELKQIKRRYTAPRFHSPPIWLP